MQRYRRRATGSVLAAGRLLVLVLFLVAHYAILCTTNKNPDVERSVISIYLPVVYLETSKFLLLTQISAAVVQGGMIRRKSPYNMLSTNLPYTRVPL